MRIRVKCWKKQSGAILFIAGCLLLFFGCAYRQTSPDSRQPSPADQLAAAYVAAVDDAANPEPDEIFYHLTPIAAGNPKLIWKIFYNQKYMLVVTWVEDSGYYKKVDKEGFYNTQGFDIWVTVVPELKQHCTDPGFGSSNFELRLKQLLGLPLNSNKLKFVELWVRPQDLFRPCPDAEINDSSCNLRMPDQTSTTHRAWFNRYRAKSYCRSENCKDLVPYPWTQLGYTYDWGNPETEVGLSEYVVKKNSKVKVERIYPTRNYCNR
jgi:hypothetical protein